MVSMHQNTTGQHSSDHHTNGQELQATNYGTHTMITVHHSQTSHHSEDGQHHTLNNTREQHQNVQHQLILTTKVNLISFYIFLLYFYFNSFLVFIFFSQYDEIEYEDEIENQN